MAIGATAVHDIEEGLPRILTSRYGIPLRDMSEAIKPFIQQRVAIGASYDMTDIRHFRCSPSKGTLKKVHGYGQGYSSDTGKVDYERINRENGRSPYFRNEIYPRWHP